MSIHNIDRNYVFIHIPRCAGTSMERVLGVEEKTGHGKIQTFYEYLTYLQVGLPKFEDIFKFAFVRNPYDRFVSGYFAQGYKPEDINDFILKGDWMDNIYFQPQWRFLCLTGSGNLMDFTGKYENLEDDWYTVCKMLDINEKLPHINKSRNHGIKYTQEARDMLRNVYSNDFKLFNYE